MNSGLWSGVRALCLAIVFAATTTGSALSSAIATHANAAMQMRPPAHSAHVYFPPALELGPRRAPPLDSRPGPFPFQTAKSQDSLIIVHYYYQPGTFGAQYVSDAQRALRQYDEPTLGYGLKSAVNIYLYNSRADFLLGAQPQNPEITGAYTDALTSTIYMPTDFDPFSYLCHELTHIVFHQHEDAGHLESDYYLYPRWLDEGMATADEPAGSEGATYLHDLLQQNLAYGGFIDIFTRFVWNYPSDSNTDDLCYAESQSFIKYMLSTYGQTRFHQFVQDVQNGDVSLAAQEALGVDLQTLQSQWEMSLGLPGFAHERASAPAAPSPIAFTTGHLTGIMTQTTPFAVPGGAGVMQDALTKGAIATSLVLLALLIEGVKSRRANRPARRSSTASARPPDSIFPPAYEPQPPQATAPYAALPVTAFSASMEEYLSKITLNPPLSWFDRVALALAVPLAIGAGVAWTVIDPAKSWYHAYLAAAIVALALVLVIGVLAWRRRRSGRALFPYLVGAAALLLIGAQAAAFDGRVAGIAQGDAYAHSRAYALAFRTLADAGAPRTELMRLQSDWADAAYAQSDYMAATEHYRTAFTFADNAGDAGRLRLQVMNLTDGWGAKLVADQQYDFAVRVYAAQSIDPTCDDACQQTMRNAEGATYLAWANDLIVHKQVSDGLARLRTVMQRLPGSAASASAKRVLDTNGKGLQAVLAVGDAGDAAAMNLLLKLLVVGNPNPELAATASHISEPATGKISPSDQVVGANVHMYFLAFHNSRDADAFMGNHENDTSLFKIAGLADGSGNFTVRLPAGYTYVPIWEADVADPSAGKFYVGNRTFDVSPFTPLTLDFPLTA